ncbi:hypothetical protein ACFVYT_38235 [Streptomyces sp. NPDC058290]
MLPDHVVVQLMHVGRTTHPGINAERAALRVLLHAGPQGYNDSPPLRLA